MALTLRLGIILERGSIVKNRVVVHELNITRLKFHHQVQLRIVGQFVKQVQCFDLKRAEWANIVEAPRRLDVLSLINRGNKPRMIIEDRNREIGFAAWRNFTASIRLNWLE